MLLVRFMYTKVLISGVVKISYSKDIFFIYKVNLSVKM